MAKFSQNKLGVTGEIPVCPTMPEAAQVKLSFGVPLHLMLVGGMYVSTSLRRAVPPARVLEVKAAISACPAEPSYSGTGSEYRKVSVVPVDDRCCKLMAGDVEICKVLIDPDFAITSGDESLAEQVTEGGGGDDDDSDAE